MTAANTFRLATAPKVSPLGWGQCSYWLGDHPCGVATAYVATVNDCLCLARGFDGCDEHPMCVQHATLAILEGRIDTLERAA